MTARHDAADPLRGARIAKGSVSLPSDDGPDDSADRLYICTGDDYYLSVAPPVSATFPAGAPCFRACTSGARNPFVTLVIAALYKRVQGDVEGAVACLQNAITEAQRDIKPENCRGGSPESESEDDADARARGEWISDASEHCRCCSVCGDSPCAATLAGGFCDAMECACDDSEGQHEDDWEDGYWESDHRPLAKRTTNEQENPMTIYETIKAEAIARASLAFGQVSRATLHPDGRPESDATHTTMLALLVAEVAKLEGLNVDLAVSFAVVHDLPEVYAGDTNTARGLSVDAKAKKEAREAASMALLESQLGADAWAIRMVHRYELQREPEARLVRFVDKITPKLTHIINGGRALLAIGMDSVEVERRHADQRAGLAIAYPEFTNSPAGRLFDDACDAALRMMRRREEVQAAPHAADTADCCDGSGWQAVGVDGDTYEACDTCNADGERPAPATGWRDVQPADAGAVLGAESVRHAQVAPDEQDRSQPPPGYSIAKRRRRNGWYPFCLSIASAHDSGADARDAAWEHHDAIAKSAFLRGRSVREAGIVQLLAGEFGEGEVGPTESLDDVVSHIHASHRIIFGVRAELSGLRTRLRAELQDARTDDEIVAAVRDAATKAKRVTDRDVVSDALLRGDYDAVPDADIRRQLHGAMLLVEYQQAELKRLRDKPSTNDQETDPADGLGVATDTDRDATCANATAKQHSTEDRSNVPPGYTIVRGGDEGAKWRIETPYDATPYDATADEEDERRAIAECWEHYDAAAQRAAERGPERSEVQQR